jgi:signal transduction histidine kinase
MSSKPDKQHAGGVGIQSPKITARTRHRESAKLQWLLDEHQRFDALLIALSARFVKVPAPEIDAQIEEALQRIVEFLGIDRSTLGEFSEDRKQFLVTHSYVAPGFPPVPRFIFEEQLPWLSQKLLQGEPLPWTRLPDDLPREAVHERDYVTRIGLKSNLTIPLKVSGSMVGGIGFGSFRAHRPWPDHLVERLRLVGEIFANALVRKRADEALRAQEQRLRRTGDELRVLAGKLLQAQEEERRRIAREMHDDWTQRLAVLAIDTARIEQQLAAGSAALAQVRAMREQLVTLSEDVHALSRQLHPAILDDLGLAEALRSECASLARREGISVDYHLEEMPKALPKNVALCIYRVAQEALRNIAKHAGVTTARLSLAASRQELLLRIQDEGTGFDQTGARAQPGLGLSSMEERVRLIQGKLAVRSEPGIGTEITVRVRLSGRES